MIRTKPSPARIAVIAATLAIAIVAFAVAASQQLRAASPTGSPRQAAEAAIVDAAVIPKLEQALGGAFGGVWFDPPTLKLHVGITSAASRQQADAVAADKGLADTVVATRVDSTWDQLEGAAERWYSRLRDLFARGEASTALLPDSNSVRVSVSSAVSSTRLAKLKQSAATDETAALIEVEPASGFVARPGAKCAEFKKFSANCNSSITSGVTIEEAAGGSCTAGPLLILKNRSTMTLATETYVLTAGHCFHPTGVGQKWWALETNANKKELGKVFEWLMPTPKVANIDAGVIKVENAFWTLGKDPPVEPHRAAWVAGAEHEPATVSKSEEPAQNMKICLSGQRSGIRCGKVLAVKQKKPFEYTEEEISTTEELAEVEFPGRAGQGDSGGPIYSEGEPEVILGHYVGFLGEAGVEGEGKIGFIQPLAVSLARFKTAFELLTKTNKVRHP
jgi:Trypsin